MRSDFAIPLVRRRRGRRHRRPCTGRGPELLGLRALILLGPVVKRHRHVVAYEVWRHRPRCAAA